MSVRVQYSWAAALMALALLLFPPTQKHMYRGDPVFDGWHPIWTLGEVTSEDGYRHIRELNLGPLLAEWLALGALAAVAILAASNDPPSPSRPSGIAANRLHWRKGMPIYRANGVSDADAVICDTAIAANRFEGHGSDEDGVHIVSIHEGDKTYVVKVEVQSVSGLQDCLIIRAAYPVAPSEAHTLAAGLRGQTD